MWNATRTHQDHGLNRHRNIRSRRRSLPTLESLEGRKLLNGGGSSVPASAPSIVNPAPVQNAAKVAVGQDLLELYDLHQQDPCDVAGLVARFPRSSSRGAPC